MKDIFILDDRPVNHPDVVARRKKQWEELSPEKQAEIDRRVAEGIARIKAQQNQQNKKSES